MKNVFTVLLLILVSLCITGCSGGTKVESLGTVVASTYKLGYTSVVTSDAKVVVMANDVTKHFRKGERVYLVRGTDKEGLPISICRTDDKSKFFDVVRTFNERR